MEWVLKIRFDSLTDRATRDLIAHDPVLTYAHELAVSTQGESQPLQDEEAIPSYAFDIVIALGSHLVDRFGVPKTRMAIGKLREWFREHPKGAIRIEEESGDRVLGEADLLALLQRLESELGQGEAAEQGKPKSNRTS